MSANNSTQLNKLSQITATVEATHSMVFKINSENCRYRELFQLTEVINNSYAVLSGIYSRYTYKQELY